MHQARPLWAGLLSTISLPDFSQRNSSSGPIRLIARSHLPRPQAFIGVNRAVHAPFRELSTGNPRVSNLGKTLSPFPGN